MRYARCCLLGVLSGLSTLLAQNSIGVALPAKPPDQKIVSVPKYNPGFRKNLTVESFGYSLAPVSKGYEFLQPTLSSGPWTTHGLECPRCIGRSPMERTRYTLPPFGTTITKDLWNDRVEIFGQLGGINAWKPDNSIIDVQQTQGSVFRRDSSFNDAWLVQGAAGTRLAVDPGRHIWLGTAGRYLQSFGVGKRHWNSFGGSAGFQWGK